MPTVENFTPSVFWTTLYGLFAFGLLFMIGYNVYNAIHTIRARHRERKEAERPDFAEKVSQKVIDKLEPRFEEIEKNLDKDKRRLESHEVLIEQMRAGQKEIHDGLSAIAKFMLVISNYGNIGEHDKVKEASMELQKYLTEKL